MANNAGPLSLATFLCSLFHARDEGDGGGTPELSKYAASINLIFSLSLRRDSQIGAVSPSQGKTRAGAKGSPGLIASVPCDLHHSREVRPRPCEAEWLTSSSLCFAVRGAAVISNVGREGSVG